MGILNAGMAAETAAAIIDLYERCEIGEGNTFTCALCQSMIEKDTCQGCPLYVQAWDDLF